MTFQASFISSSTSRGNHYPKPSSPAPFNTVYPRPLLPLREPPLSLLLDRPALPSEAQKRTTSTTSSISDDFALSTHIVPSAYPRSTPFVPLPPDADSIHSKSLGKDERKAKARKVTDELIALKERHVQGEFPPDELENRLLWNCVTRYYRRDFSPGRGQSITLLLTHANGFPKETWEPFLRYLIQSFQTSHNETISIDEIWTFEAVQHGDAALINQDKLGTLYDGSDNARDILNFLTRYLPSRELALETRSLPVHLPRVPDEVKRSRLRDGFSGDRTMVLVGHSFGGVTGALAAITCPNLFSMLILVDPVIVPPYVDRFNQVLALVGGAVQRRHEWPNREEARKSFATNPFFAAWDPAVLNSHVEFGLTSAFPNSEAVKLKMPGIQEAAVFAESRVPCEVFERIKDLDPRVALHWVMAGLGSRITGNEGATREVVWRRPVNATNAQIASEHLIVQQSPNELALEVHAVLERTFRACVQARL